MQSEAKKNQDLEQTKGQLLFQQKIATLTDISNI